MTNWRLGRRYSGVERALHRLVITLGAVTSASVTLGCPQLLDDGFESGVGSADAAVIGTPDGSGGEFQGPSGGTGGSGGRPGQGGAGADSAGGANGGESGGDGASGGTPAVGGSSGGVTCTLGSFSAPEPVTGLGRSGELWGPGISGDGLTLAFSESVNGDPEDVFLSVRTSRGAAFGTAIAAVGVNSSASEGTTFFGDDALTLYFYSDRMGGIGGRDLYVASRPTRALDFTNVRLVEGLNSSETDHMPWFSSDELTVYFASTRSGSAESSNIWFAHRQSLADGFSPPEPLSNVNSEVKDESPALTADQLTLFFVSERSGGPGNFDIWVATRTDVASPFGAAEPLPTVNSSASEHNICLSRDGTELFFSSSRDGDEMLFKSVRSCP